MTEVDWMYCGKPIRSHDDLHPDCTDIVYLIIFKNGQQYIGKKAVRAIRKKPPLKGKKRPRRIMTNLPFVKYQGSNEEGKKLKPAVKTIMHQCRSRKTATYLEMALIVTRQALFDTRYLNDNIGGKYFKDSLEGLIE